MTARRMRKGLIMTHDDETGEAAIVADGAADVVGAEPEVFSERQLKEAERIAEALVFASAEPVSVAFIAERLPRGMDVVAILHGLKAAYGERGVNLVQVGGQWAFRTAGDLSFVVHSEEKEPKKLAFACGAGGSGDCSVSSAGDTRRNRGNPWRANLTRYPRCADGSGLGAFQGPQAHAGQAGDDRHHGGVSRPFRP